MLSFHWHRKGKKHACGLWKPLQNQAKSLSGWVRCWIESTSGLGRNTESKKEAHPENRADLWNGPLEGSRGRFRKWLGVKKKLDALSKLTSVAIYAGGTACNVEVYNRSVCSANSGRLCSFLMPLLGGCFGTSALPISNHSYPGLCVGFYGVDY